MINNMTKENIETSFFIKYKKWLLALIGIHLIPSILIISSLIGAFIYVYINNDINFHSYKSYIASGYRSGHSDGVKDMIGNGDPISRGRFANTPLGKYETETDKLKEKVVLEREEYLSQFPEEEQGHKLAEMKINNIQLPLQLELSKRFTRGIDFYADYVKQRVKKEDYKSDAEYLEALKDEAWRVGYEYGYNAGLGGYWEMSGQLSLGI